MIWDVLKSRQPKQLWRQVLPRARVEVPEVPEVPPAGEAPDKTRNQRDSTPVTCHVACLRYALGDMEGLVLLGNSYEFVVFCDLNLLECHLFMQSLH